MEIDTSFISYNVMLVFQLATDAMKLTFAASCANSLDHERLRGREGYVLDEFAARQDSEAIHTSVAYIVSLFHDSLAQVKLDNQEYLTLAGA